MITVLNCPWSHIIKDFKLFILWYDIVRIKTKHEDRLANVVRTLDYGNVIMNEGHGMNPTNGKFTAPVHGIYVFHFSGSALSSTYLQVR